MNDINYETQESPGIKSNLQVVNSLFLKKKLNNVLETSLSKNLLNIRRRPTGRRDRIFDSLLWIRTKLLFFQFLRNVPSLVIDLNINFDGKVTE